MSNNKEGGNMSEEKKKQFEGWQSTDAVAKYGDLVEPTTPPPREEAKKVWMWEFKGEIHEAHSEKEMRELRESQVRSVSKKKVSQTAPVDNKKLDEIIELLKDIKENTHRSWL